MREFIFHLPYGPKEENLFLQARIRKVQEELCEGTDEWWYETRVGYAPRRNRKIFSELGGCWEELGYDKLTERAETSLGGAVRKLKKWCEGEYTRKQPESLLRKIQSWFHKKRGVEFKSFPNFKPEFVEFRDETYSPILSQ